MKKSFKIVAFFAILGSSIFLPACDKYLDVKPKGFTLLNTLSDYSRWLDGTDLYVFERIDGLVSPSDVYDVVDQRVPAIGPFSQAYVWEEVHDDPDLWLEHYASISAYNSVIVGVDDATDGTAQQKRTLKAEARLGRANELLYLINEYGKPYDSATAGRDPGVPVVVSDDVAQTAPGRGTVKGVYEFIIAELKDVVADLPDNNNNNRYRGSKAAAYSLLARACLYARNYADAGRYAQLALDASPNQYVVDYTPFKTGDDLPKLMVSPDAIYARIGIGAFTPTLAHLRNYEEEDIRLRMFHMNLGDYSFTERGIVLYFYGGFEITKLVECNIGTSIQEMMLIIAEVAARNNNLPKALELLNGIRSKRIPAADYKPYQAADADTVFNWVINERTLEFPFTGHRWFDMRRLSAEGRMPAIHRYDATGGVIATLEPGSPRYTFQIPREVISFNPGMALNP
ncbi:RagB/SusD family nutrient uptake outer membrane protein [Chitinophaga pollutisoli]|uniref:RagB/SusD family nutrient uptake outer membrane protein n=1 Tax=Chitinophaga pollutisoli TaxID=3133966 RepID=A0ABZ2YR71_9BACT